MACLNLENVTKIYEHGRPAVKNVSLSVADGELLVLLGPSGCGKSSVLRMIAGLETVTSGTISIDGRPVNNTPAKDRDIAMVFQSYALYPHMSVYDNLAFGLRRRGLPKSEIDERVTKAASQLGLAGSLTRKPYALSGGERQRVALGRAIVREPKIYLFDEPLSNLDAALRSSTRNELLRQHEALPTTTVYVTHDQVEAMTMGDRICIMHQGEIVQVGRPFEVYRNPVNTFAARFLGDPPMNLLRGTLELESDGAFVRLSGVSLRLAGHVAQQLVAYAGKDVIAGIRPEDLYEASTSLPEGRTAGLPARVVVVERLGAESILTLSVDGSSDPLIARVGRDTACKSHDRMMVMLDCAAVHLFDPATKEAILWEEKPRLEEADVRAPL
ncbi:MAG TPA: sn-glycerol-3-phosphate ABC transporter ATP-binding protein UgpC [Terriglobia bacterium]|nr:sn-glycerol-3-phosphate ABC transporter ATP-binding protein UgpC [Terriglobia bacterium]